MDTKKQKLTPIIPIYLNQKLVFDLVAMLKGGMSTVTKISSTRSQEASHEKELSANFGLSEAFSSLLSIGLNGKQQDAQRTSDQDQLSEERVHTPSSLLYELTKEMQDYVHDWSAGVPEAGSFVTFTCQMRRSPILESMETMVEFLEMLPIFQCMSESGNKPNRKLKNNRADGIAKLIKTITEQLKFDGTRDLIADSVYEDYKAVLTVEEKFLSDKSMSNLIDGTFTVFGKVVAVIPNPDNSISLLRKTLYDNMPKMKQDLLDALTKSESESDFSFQDIQHEVSGPVLQVIPVAIYS